MKNFGEGERRSLERTRIIMMIMICGYLDNHKNPRSVESRINEDGSARLAFRNISAQLHKKVVEELNRFEQ